MIYLFHDDAGKPHLDVRGEEYKYLIKVRRHQVGDTLSLRHPEHPETLYRYNLEAIDGRSASLRLEAESPSAVTAPKRLHIGWCVIDPKSVEKVLPMLNELGVAKITFIGCDRSQKNFRHDFKRYERILQASMQQCGRSVMMTFDEAATLEAFLKRNPETVVFDFCDTPLDGSEGIDTVLIGCEGGFSEKERTLLSGQRVFRLDTPMVMRSESAAVAISAKLLL